MLDICTEAQERIIELMPLDYDPTDPDQVRLRAHVNSCPACQEEERDMEKLMGWVKVLPSLAERQELDRRAVDGKQRLYALIEAGEI